MANTKLITEEIDVAIGLLDDRTVPMKNIHLAHVHATIALAEGVRQLVDVMGEQIAPDTAAVSRALNDFNSFGVTTHVSQR